MEELRKDIKETSDRGKTINDIVALVDHYNQELSGILYKHSPEEERQVSLRKPTSWTSKDIKLEKQKRRRLDRRWRKRQKNRVNALLNALHIKDNSDLVKKNANNPKYFFRKINRLLHRKEKTPTYIWEWFSKWVQHFFTQKIQTIHDYLDNPQGDGSPKIVWQDEPKFNTQFSEFQSLTEVEVRKIVLKSPNKYCELDPIPTNLLGECTDKILPLLTKVINLSLQLGNMPMSLKKSNNQTYVNETRSWINK